MDKPGQNATKRDKKPQSAGNFLQQRRLKKPSVRLAWKLRCARGAWIRAHARTHAYAGTRTRTHPRAHVGAHMPARGVEIVGSLGEISRARAPIPYPRGVPPCVIGGHAGRPLPRLNFQKPES